MYPGVCKATKKDGTLYYRVNITHKNKHISLGSFDSEEDGFLAYSEAKKILNSSSITLLSYQNNIKYLSFEKCITLINFRDNGIYIKNPIYLQKNYFVYYLDQAVILKFDLDDLFYYSSHKIQARGGHLFVSDYGMQYNILGRYGIRPYSVIGRDYSFANQDETDLRYSNIIVINKYNGVQKEEKNGKTKYVARIHLNGDFIIGRYKTEAEAAVAYNKAVDVCKSRGLKKAYPTNFVTEYTPREYADVYTELKISSGIYKFFRNKNYHNLEQ